jgi:Tol biopolymer transport system component
MSHLSRRRRVNARPCFRQTAHWIAYVSDDSGVDEVYVQRYPAAGERKTVSNGGGVEPRWSRDGHELFFRQGDIMMAVSIALGEVSLSLGPPRRLFEGPYMRDGSTAAAYPDYDVATDGRFLKVGAPPANDARVVIVLNWLEELKRLVPTK